MTDRELKWVEDALRLMLAQGELSGERKREIETLADQFQSFEESVRHQVTEFIMECIGTENTLRLFSLFIANAEREELWNEAIHVITEGTIDCYYAAMLELQVRIRHKINANNYLAMREMHRANARRFQEGISIEMQYIPLRGRNNNRICVITEHIIDLKHAPTRWVLDFSYAIQKFLGYEIIVISCPCDMNINSTKLLRYSCNRQFEGKTNLTYRDIAIKIWQISLDSKDTDGYRSLISFIAEWNPLFILQLGVFNPIAELFGKFTSLAARDFSSSVFGPISDAGILIRVCKGTDDEEQLYNMAMRKDQVQLFDRGKMPIVIQESECSLKRADLGLPEGKFLLALVGNRLDKDVDPIFWGMMERVLKNKQRAAIVLIGDALPERLIEESNFKERVYKIGYQQDLMAAYACVDLYVNPRRAGGGFSAEMALMAGVPVVTLPRCDVALRVGEGFTVSDEGQMEDQICRYVQDEAFYNMKRDQALEHSKQNGEEELSRYAKGLVGGIIGLLEEQEKRRFT